MKKITLFAIAFCFIAIQSCVKTEAPKESVISPSLPVESYQYAQISLPVGVFPANSFNNFFFDEHGNILPIENGHFNGNIEITDGGATLGRVLFYDKQLSLNNTISCGSCHHQDKAFADGNAVSVGFEGRKTDRNSMAIVNPLSQNNLFWDSRSFSISDLSLKPVQNHIEMGMENMDYLVEKLSKLDYYPNLFEAAYGDDRVTKERVSKSIAQFVASITTNESKFDYGIQTGFSNYNNLEKLGMQIFNSERAKCSSCHSGNNFAADDSPGGEYGGSGFSSQAQGPKGTTNIGLDIVYEDDGRSDGKFKIPSLRNIALTGPYMHDGRFQSLEQVVDHYSEGIKPHKDLDKKFKNLNGDVIHLNLDPIEKQALVAFLHTLTDNEMIKDPKYSDPFKQ